MAMRSQLGGYSPHPLHRAKGDREKREMTTRMRIPKLGRAPRALICLMLSLALPVLAASPEAAEPQAEALAKAGFTREWLTAVETDLAQRSYHFTPTHE